MRAVGGLLAAAAAASLALGAAAQARSHTAKPRGAKPRATRQPEAGSRALRRRVPLLRASGQRLEWTRVGHVRRYKLLIRAPGARKIVSVTGSSYRPPVIPGARVYFRVRALTHASAWSNPASISYPGATAQAAQERPHEPEPPIQEARVGEVKYRLDAASYFDPFASARYAPWVREHVALIKGFAPFADKFPAMFGLPVIGYHDPATEGQAPLGPKEVEAYVAKVQRDMAHGYAGVFIDDANWSPGFQPSPGPRANLAHLIEAVHAAEPDALIEANSQFRDIWPLIKEGNPEVMRVLPDIKQLCVENGVGPSSGIATGGEYGEFMRYVDTLHGKGIELTLTGDRNHVNVPTMEYNLATYFLINNGGDYINGTQQTPEEWWSGFDVNLGNALGPRERQPSGLWTRSFTGGVVYALEPGAATQTINLGKTMHSAQWGSVSSVTLSGGEGAVLSG